MPDLVIVFGRWWKMILTFTLAAAVIALIVCLIVPKQYLSLTTAFPVNTETNDRARIFNQNIQLLYSVYGNAEELDKLEGTARLDTIFSSTVAALGLVQHYNLPNSAIGFERAVKHLKRRTDLQKTSFGQFRILAWDEDRNMSAAIANKLMSDIQSIHQHLQHQAAAMTIEKISEAQLRIGDELQQLDSARAGTTQQATIRRSALMQQRQEYERVKGELTVASAASTPVLMVAEHAKPSSEPDKPRVLQILLFTIFGSFLFALLLSVYLQSRSEIG